MKLYQTVDEIANSISCDDVDKCKFLIENCDVNEQKMDDEVQHVIENRFSAMVTNNNVCGIIVSYHCNFVYGLI